MSGGEHSVAAIESAPNSDERWEALIAAEAASVSAAPEFARAPVMRRLLNFLVAETIGGRGDQLKAYAVAVDGLGRSPDFDAQSDSYPRVQVGRLRKMLDGHYALRPPACGLRLSIPHGRYRVAFTSGERDAPLPPAPFAKIAVMRRSAVTVGIAALGGVILLVAAVAIAVLLVRPQDKNALLGAAPVLEPAPMLDYRSLDRPDADPMVVDVVRSTMLDALRRTWVVQVRSPRRSGAPDPVPTPARYRLASELGGGARPVLFLRLWQLAPDRLLWSERLMIPTDPEQLGEALAPLVATLVQPSGVIATNERAQHGDDASPGYPCLLRVVQYRQQPSVALRRELQRCVDQTLALNPADAPTLAAASGLALDEALEWIELDKADSARSVRVRNDLTARAMGFAINAVSADPFSSGAHVAMARAALNNGACPAAVSSAMRAIGLNPYDPMLYGYISLYLLNCEDPRAEAMARRGILLDPMRPSLSYAVLAFLEIDRGDGRQARQAADQITPRFGPSAARYWLVMAIARAADGDIPAARAAWRQVERADPAAARNPADMLRRAQLAPRIRAKSLAYLTQAGIIALPAPISSN